MGTILLTFLSLFLNFPEQSEVPMDVYKLSVTFINIKSLDGDLRIGLYGSNQKFLDEIDVYEHKVVSVDLDEITVEFEIEKAGEYAVAVLHDLNRSGNMDFNFIGIPKEPYAFSKNPGIWYRAPRFDECSFDLSEDKQIKIEF